MIVLGLTGSIATGKTFVSEYFRSLGYPVFNSDDCVHNLITNNQNIKQKIINLFPECIRGNAIDKKELSKIVFNDKKSLKSLENIIHPKVKELQEEFLNNSKISKKNIAVLEIPLLFETKWNIDFDYIVVTHVGENIQKERFLSRDNVTEEMFYKIISKQMPSSEKKKLADYIIDTSKSKDDVKKYIDNLILNFKS